MGKTKQQLIVDNNTSFPNNNANYITPALLRDFNRDMIDNTVNQDVYTADSASFTQRIGDLASWSSSLDTNFASQTEFNSYTASNDAKVNAIIAATSSFVSSAITASSLTTASFSGNTLTFSKGDGTTFGVTIPDVSGSVTDLSALNAFTASVAGTNAFTQSIQAEVDDIQAKTGSFATTGSNTFYGDEIISGNIDVRDNIFAAYIDMKNAPDGNGGSIFFRASGSNVVPSTREFWSLNPIFQNGDFAIVAQPVNQKAISFGLQDGYVKFWQGLRLETGFDGWDVGNTQLIISSSTGNTNLLDVKGNVSASSAYITGSAGLNVFGPSTFTQGTITFDFASVFTNNASIQNYSGSSITFGLSATTGSNYTLKSNPFEPVLLITRESDNAKPIQMDWRDNKVTLAESGAVDIAPSAFGGFKVNTTSSFYGRGVWIIADGFTSSLAYVTASVSGSNSNLIFKNNSLTTATVVSGSSNIFQSPGAASATFGRYIGGSNNIFITSGSVPQLTGSAGISPVMNGNIINGAGTIFMRAPVSSSAYTISHNTINGGNVNFGSSAATSFVSASAGLTFTNNFSNATVQLVANKTTLVNAPNIQQNNLGGVLTLNMDSSSIGFSSNNVQGSLTVNNLYSGSTAAGNSLTVANGLFVGTNFTLVASGSNTTLTVPRQVANNVMLGSAHSASANLLGDNSNLNAVALIGHSLSVTGSSALQTALPTGADRGTVIVGRFNNDVQSHNTVFVVGAGTSGSIGITKRNALLIDSGSNTFIEGTLNVSGSTTITGSVTISGSAQADLTVVGQIFVSSSATTSATAPRITISGSAGRTVINRNGITITDATDEGGMFPSTLYAKDAATFDEVGFTVDSSVFSISGWTTGPSIYVNNPADTYPAVIGFQNKANYTDGRVTVLTPLVAQSGSIVSGSTTLSGSLTIQSGSGDLFMYGHKMFNAGAFQSNVTQSGSANVSQSVNFDTTDVSYGVTLSDNSRLNVVNDGTYLITFSLQVLADSGADTFYVWLKKNGANVPESASKLTLANNSAQLATVTFVVDALANDYYEIAWQSTQGDAVLYTEAASGNIPAIPSAIITLTQVR